MNYLREAPLSTLLLLLAIVLLAGGELYMQSEIAAIRSATAPSTSGQIASGGANSREVPTSVLKIISGSLESISGSRVNIVSPAVGGKQQHLVIDTDAHTEIVAQGAQKDQATQDADMQRFHIYAQALVQDVQKNAAALQRLIAPSPYVEQPIALTSIKQGDVVAVYYDETNTDGSLHALKITVMPTVARH